MTYRKWIATPLIGLTLTVGGGIALAPRGGATRPPTARAATFTERGMRFLQQVKANADPSFYPRAERQFRRALAVHPGHFEALFGLSSAALGRHQFAEGVRWAERARAQNPYNSDVYGALGDGLLELGRYRAAAAAFQRMVDLRPGLPAYARISYLRELRGDVEGAIEAMRMASNAAGTADDRAWALGHVADLYLNSGRPRRAGAVYRAAARLAPGTPGPLHGLAKAAFAAGEPARAERLMRRVVELSQEPGYAIFLADLRVATGRARAARRAYSLAQRLEEREERFGVNVNLEASLFAADHGMGREALDIARAEHRNRRSVHVADAHAWALFVNGRYREALRESREAFRLGTRTPLFHYHRGMIERALGHRIPARRHLRLALALNPTFSSLVAPIARKALEGLGRDR